MRAALERERLRKEQAAAATSKAVTSGGSSSGYDVARKQWELNNNVVEVTSDAYWAPDHPTINRLHREQPWLRDPLYFKEVRMSALAAVKMFIHARTGSPDVSGGLRENWHEVMGLMPGHFSSDGVLFVTDSFAMPVDASEVECSMNEHSQIYMAEYLNYHRNLGKSELGCVGWYHSHPGYSCFLSGVDVNTQQLGQRHQDPWVAVVVDPVRTISTGRLDLKAFRTVPEAGLTGSRGGGGFAALDVPAERLREYGAYTDRYYELPITIVRSSTDSAQLDALLGQYWAHAFSTNPLLANRAFATSQVIAIAGWLGAATADRRRGAVDDMGRYTAQFPCPHGEPVYRAGDLVSSRIARAGGEPSALATAESKPRYQKDSSSVANSDALRVQSQYTSTALATEVLMGAAQLSLKQEIFSNPALRGGPTSSGAD